MANWLEPLWKRTVQVIENWDWTSSSQLRSERLNTSLTRMIKAAHRYSSQLLPRVHINPLVMSPTIPIHASAPDLNPSILFSLSRTLLFGITSFLECFQAALSCLFLLSLLGGALSVGLLQWSLQDVSVASSRWICNYILTWEGAITNPSKVLIEYLDYYEVWCKFDWVESRRTWWFCGGFSRGGSRTCKQGKHVAVLVRLDKITCTSDFTPQIAIGLSSTDVPSLS